MTVERVFSNGSYHHYRRFDRNLVVLYFVFVAAVTLILLIAIGSWALRLFLVLVAMVPFLLLPPVLPVTVAFSNDSLSLNYKSPWRDVTIDWGEITVIGVWIRPRAFSIPEHRILAFFDENGKRVRPPHSHVDVSTDIVNEIKRFLVGTNRAVTVRRVKGLPLIWQMRLKE